ncbi:arginine--tRNA ligase [Sabulicella glaciei]|uniref:Arginine--tRNA ligase n=1 Tax=Sabulicella glaciei TaxID=2984948 RepID=A0ABT3NVV6_9PROT|nr:arginine--tRNA ligase [Roseococcus sp. MDT2-1-1]MCW8086299.1 arginine--tRNA ligase [Roseococcus sp. MDT2-1-1]
MNDDIFAHLRGLIVAALGRILPDLPAEAFSKVVVEPPREASHGDMATNAALVVGKAAKLPPPKLAAQLAEALASLPEVAEATPAGPGFVNIRLEEGFLRAVVPLVLRRGEAFGEGAPKPGRVNLEYVSANPTGPMHVGHCRGAVVGDALAGLLSKAGFDVTKEYYINDAGAQVQALAWASFWRYLEALPRDAHGLWEEGADEAARKAAVEARYGVQLQYGGHYLLPVGQALAEAHGSALLEPSEANLLLIRRFAVERMMEEIRADLAALGVRHDVFVSEAALIEAGKLEEAEARLAAQNLIYRGVLEPPKGKTPEDWEPREQTLFRATDFGDEVDRPLRKSDGSGTYFANDIANHLHKLERGFTQLLHVWGADHGGYVRRMQAAVAALSSREVPLDVVLAQIVHVVKDGQPVRMSKRAGTYVTLADLIEEVGKDAVRFTMLTRKSDAQMEFDLDLVVQQSRDNPVFYVQYAHARARSVLRAAGDPAASELEGADLSHLSDPAELGLIRRMASWPRVVEGAAAAREPHRIAFFLNDLAGDFHLLWNKGKDDTALRFIQDAAPEATKARLALVSAMAVVIRSGLGVMGVTPVEEMR